MMLEWARSLLARIGRTTLLGIAILDLGATPRAEDGHRRYGHFTACPDELTLLRSGPRETEGYGTAARSTYTEVARPDPARRRPETSEAVVQAQMIRAKGTPIRRLGGWIAPIL